MNVDRFEARWKMWSSQPMWSPIVRPWALVIKQTNGRAWGHKGCHRGSTIRGDWFNPIPHPLHGPQKMWQFPTKNMVSLRGCLILGGRDYMLLISEGSHFLETFNEIQLNRKAGNLEIWGRHHRITILKHLLDLLGAAIYDFEDFDYFDEDLTNLTTQHI